MGEVCRGGGVVREVCKRGGIGRYINKRMYGKGSLLHGGNGVRVTRWEGGSGGGDHSCRENTAIEREHRVRVVYYGVGKGSITGRERERVCEGKVNEVT